ncbi:MAG: 50S ribosomal protein L5 [Candidatus Omnitrophica bacterium]|nr:50S ribosomal protein L5 [Candidatus Omnitrophota bacterium]
MKPELFQKYQKEVIPALKEKLGIKNPMALPTIEKVVVNMGVGEALTDLKILDASADDLATITGQKPSIRRSRKAISNFKLRLGAPIGCKVTLRRDRMYEFLGRLINVVLPRIRDFNGISTKSFDREGNYTLGVKEHSIFPEIDPTRRDFRIQGMDISIVIKNGSPEKNLEFLKLLGVPFEKKQKDS